MRVWGLTDEGNAKMSYHLAFLPAQALLAQVSIDPSKTDAPGADGLQKAINGFAYYALLAAAAGFVIGAAIWALGGRLGNDYASANGKTGMAVAVAAAFLVGAATAILNFAFKAGGT
ncbi:MAG TPA: DUF6112 family protein [Solirubrobacteraceae bacterium]|jgi:vacuolar-type H+-ATPase subunit I/STV1|nr:DUF6112 family protein [Solirubrobacteraceae bacterium]